MSMCNRTACWNDFMPCCNSPYGGSCKHATFWLQVHVLSMMHTIAIHCFTIAPFWFIVGSTVSSPCSWCRLIHLVLVDLCVCARWPFTYLLRRTRLAGARSQVCSIVCRLGSTLKTASLWDCEWYGDTCRGPMTFCYDIQCCSFPLAIPSHALWIRHIKFPKLCPQPAWTRVVYNDAKLTHHAWRQI